MSVTSRPARRITRLAALAGASILALSACSATDDASSQSATTDTLSVVASTDIYGSLAQSIGGEHVTVTSVISDPSADPHSYEATAQDRATLSEADVVLYNGGHYDAWVETAVASSDIPTIDAVALYGTVDHTAAAEALFGEHDHDHAAETTAADTDTDADATEATEATEATDDHDHDHATETAATTAATDEHDHDHADEHDHSELNEHVWYDLPTMYAMAEKLRDRLSELDPDNASAYAANFTTFASEMTAVADTLTEIAENHQGIGYVQTEPVAGYLMDYAHLVDVAPAGYQQALINENEPAAADVAGVLDEINAGHAKILLVNPQTEDELARNLQSAATANNVTIVKVYETLPEGTTSYTALLSTVADDVAAAAHI